jgi:hypothetical protein
MCQDFKLINNSTIKCSNVQAFKCLSVQVLEFSSSWMYNATHAA